MLSSYRLGDLVLLDLNESEINDILVDHPNTIGSEYIMKKKANPDDNNIDIITNIVLKHVDKYADLLPKNIHESTLIHLRLGDVVAGNQWHEVIKRPVSVSYLKKIVPNYKNNNNNNNNKTYVIGKCFFSKPSSTNYDECIKFSNQYLNNVINQLNAEHFDGGHADIDLCCAIKSKCFVQGRGFFSKLIIDIRKKLNLECVETSVHD